MPLENCPGCGLVLKENRSHRHHRFYFKAIDCALLQWPESHAFQPDNADHLRAWLQVRIGHHDMICQENDGDLLTMADFAGKVLDKARTSKSSGFIETGPDNTLIVKFPRSINWSQVTQAQFQPIAQKVFDLIEAEIGVPVEQLVFETERAA